MSHLHRVFDLRRQWPGRHPSTQQKPSYPYHSTFQPTVSTHSSLHPSARSRSSAAILFTGPHSSCSVFCPSQLPSSTPFAGLLVLRFLQGVFGGPALANAGAMFQDMYSLLYVPYTLSWWVGRLASDPFYVPLSYPRYAASLFADNDLARSSMAADCIPFSRPLSINLGVAKGVSVLAGLSTMRVFGMMVIYLTGATLRRDLSLPRARPGCGDHGESNMSHLSGSSLFCSGLDSRISS
jgi:hypothetical protein